MALGRQDDRAAGAVDLALHGRGEQLTDEQGVAAAEPPDAVERRGGDVPAQDVEDERLGGVLRQRPDVEAAEQLVLPQGAEAGRDDLARPHADEHLGRGLGGHQVQQGDRDVVEQVGVIDRQQQPAAGALGPGVEPGQRLVEQVVTLVGLVAGSEQVGERPERDLPGRLGRPHPLDRGALRLAPGDRLGDDARLAHARLAEDRGAPGRTRGAYPPRAARR